MRRFDTLLTLLAILSTGLLWACGDSGRSGDDDSDGGTGDPLDAGSTPHPDAVAPAADASTRADVIYNYPDVILPPGPGPAYVELEIEPRSSLYTRDDHPEVFATVYNRFGDILDDVDLVWDTQPPGTAELSATQALTFLVEGQGAVRACATPDLCGRVSFYVDDGPPALEVTSPTRGSLVVGARPRIEIRGSAQDTGPVRVFVNTIEVDVAPDGGFVHTIDATFGLNRIDVVADDGVRRPSSRVVMEVLWAPAVVETGEAGVIIENGAMVHISQALLDGNAPVPEPDDEGVQRVSDLAAALETLLMRADPMGLLQSPEIASNESLTLRIDDIRLGHPDITLLFTDTGLEIFLRIDGLEVDTRGTLSLQGNLLSLDGVLTLEAATFVTVAITAGAEGEPRVTVEDVGVAIEAIGGELAEPMAQAVLDTFGSLLRTEIDDFAEAYIDELVADAVPEFLDAALARTLDSFGHVRLDVPTEGLMAPFHLDLFLSLSTPVAHPRTSLDLGLTAEIRQPGPVIAPHPDPGIPSNNPDALPPWPAGANLAVGAQLLVVNALLHELWRQNGLRMDLAEQIPDQFAALITEATTDARIAPLVVALPPGSPYFFQLQIGEFDLYASRIGRAEPDHYILSVRSGVVLKIVDGRQVQFEVAESSDIRVELASMGGASPIVAPALLAALLQQLVWAKLRETIHYTLDLPFEEIRLEPDQFGRIAPSLQDIVVVPAFPGDPLVRNGWFVMAAGFEAQFR